MYIAYPITQCILLIEIKVKKVNSSNCINWYLNIWAIHREIQEIKMRQIILILTKQNKTRRLVGVHSSYMVLVSGPQNGQWQCGDVACWETVCYADCLGGEY